jgi:hypothetical protein
LTVGEERDCCEALRREELYEVMRDASEATDAHSEILTVQQGRLHIGRNEDNWTYDIGQSRGKLCQTRQTFR